MKNASDRQTNLDIAKGIGIVLVVWAHAFGPFSSFINSFHMPFFFFVSGMLYKNNKSVSEYTKSKMKSLLLPFWTYNLMFYPIFFILFYWRKWDFQIYLKAIIEIIVTVNKVPFLGATWFLAALFWVSVLFHVVYRFFDRLNISVLFMIPISAAIMAIGFHITFPYRISRTLICSGFYVMGFMFNKYLRERINVVVGGFVAVPMGIFAFLWSKWLPSDISSNEYSNKMTFNRGNFCNFFSHLCFYSNCNDYGKQQDC